MRTVECTSRIKLSPELAKSTGRVYGTKVEVGKFHQWGIEYEEFDTGPGNYTVAVVELFDGQVKTFPANDVKFIEER